MPTSKSAGETTPEARLEEGELYGLLGYQVAQASVTTFAAFERSAGAAHDLRPGEFTVLLLVKSNPDVTPSRLARALAVTAPNITAWINRLEQRGLVRRILGVQDKRNQHLRVTADGARLGSKAVAAILHEEKQAWPGLSAAEQGMLIELLHKVSKARRVT
jgi:DNA-binding MarR family transcriptional regulator